MCVRALGVVLLCANHSEHSADAAVFPFYNIVIWSATSMKWIDVKLKALGLLDHAEFKISMCIDHGAMIPVDTPRYGRCESASFKQILFITTSCA